MTTDLKLIEKIVGILRRAADQELANGLKDTWPGFCPNADIKIKEGKFTHDNLIAHQAVAMTLGEEVMAKFLIIFDDPVTGAQKEEVVEFFDSHFPEISAKEWAEDYAYMLADKGRYQVTEINHD